MATIRLQLRTHEDGGVEDSYKYKEKTHKL